LAKRVREEGEPGRKEEGKGGNGAWVLTVFGFEGMGLLK